MLQLLGGGWLGRFKVCCVVGSGQQHTFLLLQLAAAAQCCLGGMLVCGVITAAAHVHHQTHLTAAM